MRWWRELSLLWRILLSTSIAITLLFAVIGWIVQDQLVRVTTASLEDEVRASFQAYDSLWKARTEKLSMVALVLSRMPDVRSAFGTRDAATIRDSASEIWSQVSERKGLFVVTDPRGAVVAALGAGPPAGLREVIEVREALPRFPSQSTGFLVHEARLYQIVITPVYVASSRGAALLNVLVTGFPVDRELAAELSQSTGGSEFNFLVRGRVVASSLEGASGQVHPVEGAPRLVSVGGEEYMQFSTALKSSSGREVGSLVILRDFRVASSRVAELRLRIIVLWMLAVLAGLSLTALLARRLLQPVQALDEAASRLARGEDDIRVDIATEDEIGRLGRTFNTMCSSLRLAREELIRRERIATISRLSTSIIHDLRNPLAAIYGGAEMMMDSELTPTQSKRLATNIYRSSRRVQELLQELAGVTGGQSHARELCRLREVVDAARVAIAQNAESRGVETAIDIDPRLELTLDRSAMERVFQNLLGNAIEAMTHGGRVSVEARSSDGGVLIRVEDDGPGVPAQIMPRLFHPFVTAGKKNGMGLGLALSRQTVLDHGGDLWLDPDSGGGARFWLRLPA